MNREEAHLDQCTQEHILQAISYLDSDEWLQLFHPPVYPSEYEEIQKIRFAVSTVLTALRGPQPDPITGLVPCGCGGKVKYINSYYDDVWMYENYVGCPDCYASSAHISTSKHGYSKEMETEIKLKLKDNWNTAMGQKGGAK